ncbi:DNA-binding protein HU [Granulibacter bethesdensis]|uniref:DNA-binding protein HU n=2 Tax=Granulibacter bethesdensis TaxID=364410 RepID=Q0BSK0_GRABC|nr:DNA-binding protein HU [Granulibacter bethesdensis CGDNIH1]AHJ68891.1 DNA-binding protein HU [Granulibacter bethesdensis]APH52028.1 DNA-binding protein HU [Granulibacter bethesdensis]APH64718.1 DNA-binding protein HU [Granulibacter bethesdensis]
MNKMELITAVADELELPRSRAAQAVDAVLGSIESALKRHEEVRLVGFGSFSVASRKASVGRNPRTGEEIAIPPALSVRFKAGKTLKDALNEQDSSGE